MPGINTFTVLMLHCDGVDGSTTFIDSSPSAKTVNVAGNAQIDTAFSVFGSGSLLCDGTGDDVHFAAEADFAFGTGDFGIDLRFRPAVNPVNGATAPALIDFRPAATEGLYPVIYFGTDGKLRLYVSTGVAIAGSTVLAQNTTYHVALTRASGSTRLFLNGTQEGSTFSDSNSYLVGAAGPLIGRHRTGIQTDFNGWIDEVRIQKGEAPWTATFTPSLVAYDNFNETVGAAAGVGAATGVGASTGEGVGSAAGTGTALADSTGSGVNEGVGTATGTGAAYGIGIDLPDVVGSCAAYTVRGHLGASYDVTGEARV